VTVQGEALGDGIAVVWPKYRVGLSGCESVKSMSVSNFSSRKCGGVLTLSRAEGC